MKQILLDADNIYNEKQANDYFRSVFKISEECEFNLDALYSAVMSINENTEIKLQNADYLVDELGRYGLGLIKLLRDAEQESKYITFDW